MSLSRAIVIAASMIASGLSFGPASAEEQPSLTAEDRLTLTLKSQIREKDSVADIKEKMLYLFKMTDIDGGGVSESDYELKRQLGSSQSRIRKMTRWLGNDLDGDGGVTRAELEAVFGRKARQPMKSAGVTVWPTETQVAETVSKLVDEALEDDKDNDGTITFTEALTAASDQTPKQSGQGFNRNRPVHLSLDRNGDGTVTENEFTEAVEKWKTGQAHRSASLLKPPTCR